LNYFFSTFYWKNPAAGYLSIFLPITFFALLLANSKLKKIIYNKKEDENTILEVMTAKKDGHLRELIKILSIMKLDDEQEGIRS
jgi:hypothetical protein